MKMKKFSCLMLSFLFLMTSIFTSFADVFTSSNATPSNPFAPDPDRLLGSQPPAAEVEPFSSAGTVVNTVSPVGVYCYFIYVNSDYSDSIHCYHLPTFKDNTFYISFSAPANVPSDYFLDRVEFYVSGKSLPPSGGYKASFDFSSSFSVNWRDVRLFSRKYTDNASSILDDFKVGFKQISGDVYVSPFELQLTNVAFAYYVLYVDDAASVKMRNMAGYFDFGFTPFSVSSSAPSTAGTDTSEQDYENSVSSGLSNISSSVSDMSSSLEDATQSLEYISESQNLIIEGIDNIILHISDQLYAFWDQLFNLIHVPTMAKLDQILQAIKDMDINVNVDLDELKNAIANSATKISNQIQSSINSQIANDNKNADEIMNGYDNAGMEEDKGRLDDIIEEYDKVEDELFDDAKENIEGFEYENPFEQFAKPIADLGFFLQGIYMALGALGIPISFSLTLTIALILIGWYRFKGGG